MGCCPRFFTGRSSTELEPLREHSELVSGFGEVQARWAQMGEGFLHKEHFQGRMQNNLVNTENILNRSERVKEILQSHFPLRLAQAPDILPSKI